MLGEFIIIVLVVLVLLINWRIVILLMLACLIALMVIGAGALQAEPASQRPPSVDAPVQPAPEDNDQPGQIDPPAPPPGAGIAPDAHPGLDI
jgi:hypothetical protein